jgi:hypothetical protein
MMNEAGTCTTGAFVVQQPLDYQRAVDRAVILLTISMIRIASLMHAACTCRHPVLGICQRVTACLAFLSSPQLDTAGVLLHHRVAALLRHPPRKDLQFGSVAVTAQQAILGVPTITALLISS